MLNMKFQILAITVLLLFKLILAQKHWSYPDYEDNNVIFPTWGGICDTGKRQSPIDLDMTKALKGVFGKFEFSNYNNIQKGVSMVNNGHSIQLFDFPDEMVVSGGPLSSNYIVEQMHFHWWSEHTIDNMRYPLEVHIVHRNARYATMAEAANHTDGLMVLGILHHVSNQKNDALNPILKQIDEVKSYTKIDEPITLKNSMVVEEFFPNFDSYMTYDGSLTTPGCAEIVTWIVLYGTYPVTLEQVDAFKQIETASNHMLTNNYRLVQKTYNRPITFALVTDRAGKGDAAALKFSFAFIILSLLVTKILQ